MRAALLLAIMAAAGCATTPPENIPRYPLMDPANSIATIQQRAKGLQSVSGEGNITLTDASRNSMRLDAAFVLAPPDRARVRAWKLGQAVLDVTVRPDGTWLYLPRENSDRAAQLRSASEATDRIIRQCLMLLCGQFANDATMTEQGSVLTVAQPAGNNLTLRCEIDRPTLTARRCILDDPAGVERFALKLASYREVGGTVWPTRIEATSNAQRVIIETRDLEANEAPESAFMPPARAVKTP